MSPTVRMKGKVLFFVHDCTAECGDGVTRDFSERTMVLDGRWSSTVVNRKRTVTPSIQCDACGLHGHWTAGKWIPA